MIDRGFGGGPHEREQLIVSEERLDVTTVRVATGIARLEKYLVTETRTFTVDVTHEEVRLVRGELPDGVVDEQSEVRSATEVRPDDSRWMTVSAEEIVVTTRVVPRERVRLEVYPVVEQREVTADVRREDVEMTPTD